MSWRVATANEVVVVVVVVHTVFRTLQSIVTVYGGGGGGQIRWLALHLSYLCLELLVRATFAIVVGVRASTVNNKFRSIRLATSRSELLHSAVVLSSICAQKTSGALPAIHPSRGSCQNLPCTTKVSRIPRGRVAHVLVDTERKRESV